MRSEIRQLPIGMALRAVRGPKNLPGICYVGWPTMMGRSGSHRTMGDLGVRHWPEPSWTSKKLSELERSKACFCSLNSVSRDLAVAVVYYRFHGP